VDIAGRVQGRADYRKSRGAITGDNSRLGVVDYYSELSQSSKKRKFQSSHHVCTSISKISIASAISSRDPRSSSSSSRLEKTRTL